MPSSPNYVRDYSMSGEGKYDKSPKRMADNRARKKARSLLEMAGKAKRGDGKDVDHKNRNALDNRPGNLSVMSRAANLARKRK